MPREARKVILAASVAGIFERCDFYLDGSLAAVIGAQYFTAFSDATRNVFALPAFAAGFLLRRFGALVFGALGDLVGRKPIILMRCAIAALTFFPICNLLTRLANPALCAAHNGAVVTPDGHRRRLLVQFNPVGTARFTSACDVAKALPGASRSDFAVNCTPVEAAPGTLATVAIGETVITSCDPGAVAAQAAEPTAALETARAGTDQDDRPKRRPGAASEVCSGGGRIHHQAF